MRVRVGETLLGDVTEDLPIGGFSGSATGDTHTGRGTSTGLQRLRDLGNVRVSMSVPTKRTFDTVAEAQKWMLDTLKAGGYSGPVGIELADGSTTEFDWGVARPSNISHQGVLVIASWSLQAGKRLT